MSKSCSDVCEAVHEMLLCLGFQIDDVEDHSDMLDALDQVVMVKKIVVTFEEALTMLKSVDNRNEYAIAIWSIDDVIERADERDKKMTRKQALDVIGRVERNQDAEMGINWNTLDAWIDTVLNKAKKKGKSKK